MAINPTFRNTMTAIIIVTMFLKPVCDCTVFLVVLETSKWHSSTKGVTKLKMKNMNIRNEMQDSWVPNDQFNLYCSEPIELEASIVITLSSWTTPMVFGCFLSAHLPIRWNALGHTGVSGFLLLWYVEELFGRIRRKKRKRSLVMGIARLLWRLNLIIWPKMSHRATSTKPFLTGTGVFEDQEATHWLPALKFMPPTSLLDASM